MKYIVLIFLSILHLPLLGQVINNSGSTKIKVSETFYATPDKTYVDSVETIWSKTYLDTNNIERAMVFKENHESLGNSRVATFITWKKKVDFVSLADLYFKLNINDSVPVKFFVDEQLLEDTCDVRFEPTVIYKIDVVRNEPDNVGHSFERSIHVLITTQWRRTSIRN